MLILIDFKCISESLECIEHLVKEGGSDMASHSILTKFQQKIESDEGLLEPVLRTFKESPILYKEFLGSIILAGANSNFNKLFQY